MVASSTPDPLLPPDALSGVRIGLSASESPDLSRLGLVETHFRLALAEVARSVLVGGGKLAYGGHLNPDGYTTFLMHELQRYGLRNRPLRVCLSWTQHRELTLEELSLCKIELGVFGEIVCLDSDGIEIDPTVGRGPEGIAISDDKLRKRSLTGLRLYLACNTSAQILIGGKRDGYQGDLPGVLEEATIALQKRKPLYLAGGFGGMTADILRVLRPKDALWLRTAPPTSSRISAALSKLTELVAEADTRDLNNGLSAVENARLAATPHPSEIAALVSLGLGRRFRADNIT